MTDFLNDKISEEDYREYYSKNGLLSANSSNRVSVAGFVLGDGNGNKTDLGNGFTGSYDGRLNFATAAYNAKAQVGLGYVKAKVSGEVALVSGEISGKIENDYVKGELSARGTLCSVRGEAGIEASIGKDGVKIDAKVEAMAALAEGEINGSVQLKNVAEVKGGVTGYAGAIGVKGEAGFDSKTGEIKLSFGVAVGVGFGFDLSIKPTGLLADILGVGGGDKDDKKIVDKKVETVSIEGKANNNIKDNTSVSSVTSYGNKWSEGIERTTTTNMDSTHVKNESNVQVSVDRNNNGSKSNLSGTSNGREVDPTGSKNHHTGLRGVTIN